MRQTLSVSTALLLALLALVPMRARAQTPGNAYSCDGAFYQIRQVAVGTANHSQLFRVNRNVTPNADPTTTPYTTTLTLDLATGLGLPATSDFVVNSLAYNARDGYMYALTYPVNNTGFPTVHLYRIGSGVEDLGIITVNGAAPVGTAVNPGGYPQLAGGVIDEAGFYYAAPRNLADPANKNLLFRFDLNQATNAGKRNAVTIPMDFYQSTAPSTLYTPTTTQDFSFIDLGYNPIDGLVYGVYSTGSVYKFDFTTTPGRARVTRFGTAPATAPNLGSVTFDVAGNLYAYSNEGNFYTIDLTTGAATDIGDVPTASVTDGASCVNPSQRIDVVKELSNVVAINATTFDVSYTIRVKNTGTVTATNVQVSDFLRGANNNTTFPTSTSVTIQSSSINANGTSLALNPAYTGQGTNGDLLTGNQQLTAGQSVVISFTARVVFPAGGVPTTVQNNQAYASSISGTTSNPGYSLQGVNGVLIIPPGDLIATDASSNGAVLPATPNGDTPSPTPVTFAPSISGTVFEDVNYGGGLGRSQGNASGVGRGNARVELYNVTGGVATFSTSTLTAADGTYSFTGLTAGNSYVVRVVNSTVTSSRTGGPISGLVPVQTYRTQVTAAAGTVADLNRVGGEDPSRGDAAQGGAGTVLSALNISTSGLLIGTIAQSQAPIVLGTATTRVPAVNVDFGYNFDLIVNTNDGGQGSFRQFVANSNTLPGESSLAQVYTGTTATTALTAGQETSIFMIPNGAAVPGQVAGLTSGFSGGTATITLQSALNPVSGTLTNVDGSTQTRSTGNSNPAVTTAGAESTGPEIVLNLNGQTGLAFSGASERLLGLGITGSASGSSGVLVNGTANGLSVSNNTIYSNGVNVTVLSGATAANISNNVIRSSTRASGGGIVAQSGTDSNVFSQNTFGGNNGLAIDLTNGTTANGDGVTLNDNGDADTGANGLLNYPVITSATVSGTNLVVKGYARPGSQIELYAAAADPTNFGEGQLYLTTVTEGTADNDTRTGLSYSGLINGLNQGSDNTANGFSFTIPLSSLPGGTLAVNTVLTATATLGGATSEFSGNVTTNAAPIANNVTNKSLATTAPATVLNPNLSATPDGAGTTIATYTVFPASSGTLYFNGVAVSASGTTLNASQLNLLTYQPTSGFVGNATFSYSATDNNGIPSNTATYTIPVTAVANVATTISGATPNANGTLTLAATFRNLGPSSAANVTRYVQLPAGLTTAGATVTATAGATYNNVTGLIAYTTPVATLATGVTTQDVSVTITNLPASYSTFLAVSRIATTSDENGAVADNVAQVALTVTPQTDLTTSLNGPASVVPGNLATYVVTTRNNGVSPAASAGQTVQLPANLSGVLATNGGVYDASSGVVTFPAVALVTGQVVTNSVSFTALAGSFSPSATVTLNSGTDTNAANNTAYLNGAASLTAVSTTAAAGTGTNVYTKVTGPAQTAASAQVTYTVEQGNRGPATANGVQTQVMLPVNQTAASLTVNGTAGSVSGTTITFPSGATYSQSTGVLTLPAIASQASAATTSYTIALNAPSSGPSFPVTASVVTSTPDLVPADNVSMVETEILPVTDVAISIFNTRVNGGVAATNNETAGQILTYGVQTVNNTAITAQNVQQVVNLSVGFDPATLQVNGQTGTVGATTVTFASGAVYTIATGSLVLPVLPSLAGSGTAFTTVSYEVAGNGPVRAAAEVTTSTTETSLTNNASQFNPPNGNSVTLVVDPTVQIAGPAQAVVGNPALYTVVTSNNGPSTSGTTATSLVLPTNLAPATLLLNNVAGTYDGSNVVTFANGSTYTLSTGALTAATTNPAITRPGAPGSSFTVQFITPDVALLSVSATVTSSVTDENPNNNTDQVITPLVTSGLTGVDLVTTLTGPATPVAGSVGRFTVTTTNGNVQAASNVVQTVSLPSGLANNGATVTISNGGTYNNATGLVTFPTTATLAVSGVITNTIDVTLPGGGAFSATASSALSNPDTNPANNTVAVTVNPSNRADVTTAISGPASVLAGATASYAIVTSNVGPSNAGGTTQTLDLPAGVTSYTLNGTTIAGSGTVTIRTASTLASGVSETVIVSFTAPSSTYNVTTNVATATAETAVNATNSAQLTTTVLNQKPVAYDVVNTLATPEGNTAGRMPISPLVATDAETATINSFQFVSLPDPTTQGTLYYSNGGTPTAITAAAIGTNFTLAQIQSLSFDPVAPYVGTVAFNYTGTDGQGLVSNVAKYTLAVGQDNNSVYARPTTTKGGNTNKYVAGDVLAYVIDINGALYNSAGQIYDPVTGALITTSTVDNGIMSASISPADAALLAGYGIAFSTTTGLFTVADPTKLPRAGITLAPITVTTIDTKGGTNTNAVTLVTGANPLPVELVTFTAQAVKNLDAQLTWRTASEKNNDRFEVERSFNGTDFVKIGQVKGQGSTASATDYALTDAGVAKKARGPVYYRLKQVDADGSSSYSPVRQVAFTQVTSDLSITLSPNPATSSTQLDLTALPTGSYQVNVLDALGRTLLQGNYDTTVAHALDLNTIASGAYIVLVRGQNGGQIVNLTTRLIKE